MAGLTKSQIAEHMAEKSGLTKKNAALFLEDERGDLGIDFGDDSGTGKNRPREPQGSDGPQSRDRRADQDPGQARREVPRREGRQGRDPRREEVAGLRRPSADWRRKDRQRSLIRGTPGRVSPNPPGPPGLTYKNFHSSLFS